MQLFKPFFAIGLPGGWEWFIIVIVVLIVFGGSRIPKLGRDLGRGIRGFKDGLSGKEEDDEPEQVEDKKSNSKKKS